MDFYSALPQFMEVAAAGHKARKLHNKTARHKKTRDSESHTGCESLFKCWS